VLLKRFTDYWPDRQNFLDCTGMIIWCIQHHPAINSACQVNVLSQHFPYLGTADNTVTWSIPSIHLPKVSHMWLQFCSPQHMKCFLCDDNNLITVLSCTFIMYYLLPMHFNDMHLYHSFIKLGNIWCCTVRRRTFYVCAVNKVKVKLSLCLTKHHTMKTCWGSGGIAPCILDVTRWRWVVSFTPWPLYPQGKSSWYPLDRRLGGPQCCSGHGGEEKNSQVLINKTPEIISLTFCIYLQFYTLYFPYRTHSLLTEKCQCSSNLKRWEILQHARQ
jgi:hypothetical protein